jgi:hypothetical protein
MVKLPLVAVTDESYRALLLEIVNFWSLDRATFRPALNWETPLDAH